MPWKLGRSAVIAIVSAPLAASGCTHVVHLQDPKTGQDVTCGGEMVAPGDQKEDQQCLIYWQKMGYKRQPDKH